MKCTDPDGRAAGDEFDSMDEAAMDWANTYADDSIAENTEFGSTIYSYEKKNPLSKKNEKKYSYNIPNKGLLKKVEINNQLEAGQKAESSIHSHGSLMQFMMMIILLKITI